MLVLSQRHSKKRAFITGAGSGLGAALSRQLAADGWTIGLCDLRPEGLQETAAAVEAAGGKAVPFMFDVTDRAAFGEAAEKFIAQHQGVDLVINNAGVAGAGLVGEYTLDDWEWLLRINLFGPVYGCHFFAPQLRQQKSGHVINIASAAALFAVPRMAAYCSAKAAVKMLSEVLFNEMKPLGVDVSVVMPEFFQTNLYKGARGSGKDDARKMILGSKYTADDVAAVVLAEAGKRQLHITFPRRVQPMWWLTRLAPLLGNSLIRAEEKRQRSKSKAPKSAAS
jgi:NAD(P)-dependent dehydrogenase (short-subunit alcohol dehydrogenase family)